MMRLPYYIIAIIFSALAPMSVLRAQEVTSLAAVEDEESAVKFVEYTWNFGDVKEDGGSVSHKFVFTNTSSRPVVVLDVSASCGCTSPSFSRKPVMPGAKGEIDVAFDPINRPGHFSKGVVVKLADNERVTLNVEGNVIPRERSVEELYPFEIGSGLRLDLNFHAFSYLGRGESAETTIVIYNTSSSDATLELRPRLQSGMLAVEAPKRVAAQSLAKIVLRYFIPEQSNRYGMLDDAFDVYVNGKKSKTLISTHAIAVDKFDPVVDDMSAPSCELSKNFIKFGETKQGAKVTDATVELINDSEAELVIRAVEWKSKAMGCSLKAGDRLKAGEKRKVEISFDSAKSDGYGVWVERLSIITNSPLRPMITLRVTAIVVE